MDGGAFERVVADDYEGCVRLDKRPPHLRTRPKLSFNIFSPRVPVFTSLELTSKARTSKELFVNELSDVLNSNDYKELSTRSKMAKQRLERLGIFEPGSVELYLVQPPKLLVETETTRKPPFLVVEAVEKDILRLQAKPYAEISGLDVGTAEVGYEASGTLRNITGYGDISSGRYVLTKGSPPELQASISIPCHVSLDRILHPLDSLHRHIQPLFSTHQSPSLLTHPYFATNLPVVVTGEVCRDEENRNTTSSFSTETLSSRLKFTSGNHAVGFDMAWRESIPVRSDTINSNLRVPLNSKKNEPRKLTPNLKGLFAKLPFSSSSSSSSSATTCSEEETSAKKEMGKDNSTLGGQPVAYASSLPILKACSSPSVKHSVSYSWQQNNVVFFNQAASNSKFLDTKTSFSNNTDEEKDGKEDESPYIDVSYVIAPGDVITSGHFAGSTVELAGRGLVSPFIALTSLPNLLFSSPSSIQSASKIKSPNLRQGQTGGNSTIQSSSSLHDDRFGYFGGFRRAVGDLLGGDTHFAKWGGCFRYHKELTAPYVYLQPSSSDESLKTLFQANKLASYWKNLKSNFSSEKKSENEFVSSTKQDLKSKGYTDNNDDNGLFVDRYQSRVYGVAPGIVLNLSLNGAFLLPFAKQPMTNPSPESNLCDRFFLGGSKRYGFNSMGSSLRSSPSNFYSRNSGAVSFLGCEDGLRGFATSGAGPRSKSKTSKSSTCSGKKDVKDEGGLLSGDSLGGNVRLSGSVELSAPIPHPQLAAAGLRCTASLQAGLLSEDFSSNLCDAARASSTVGIGLPLGPGSHIELLCSHPLRAKSTDVTEKWQISMSVGIGSD